MKNGKRISDDERRSRTIDQLIQYGLRMGLSLNTGGHKSEDQITTQLRRYTADRAPTPQEFVDRTARQACKIVEDKRNELVRDTAKFVCEVLTTRLQGFADRQRPTIDELVRRVEIVRNAYERTLTADDATGAQDLRLAIAQLLYGVSATAVANPDEYVLVDDTDAANDTQATER